MFCSLSGQKVKDPVVSPKSGKIFERNLIVTYLSTNRKDPINDEPLGIEELIPISLDGNDDDKNIITPKPPSFNSIPSLLSTFQNEFDSMALEIFTLRKLLNTCKQELSSALYHYDAAVKVAANAIKERDEAKLALQELSVSIGTSGVNGHKTEDADEHEHHEGDNDITGEVPVELIESTRAELFQLHKSQKVSLPMTETINISFDDGKTMKKYNASYFDELYEKLLINHGKELIITDLTSKQETKITHRGGMVCVNLIEFNNLLTPIYATKTQVKFDSITMNYPQEIVDIKSHPKLKFLYVVCTKNSWTLNSEDKKLSTNSLTDNDQIDSDQTITTSEFHIDGEIFAIGTNQNNLLIYNVTTNDLLSTLTTKYSLVTKLQYGLNGYWLLAASTDPTTNKSALEIYDLRKSIIINCIDFDQLNDFTMDKSCSLILSSNGTTINAHQYVKKGKSWNNFFKSQQVNSSIGNLFITAFNDECIDGIGLGSTKIFNYKIDFVS